MSVESAISRALKTARNLRGISVVYHCGDNEINLTKVGRGSWIFKFQDEHGTTKRIETRDFLIEVAQLLVDDEPIEPVIGHRIDVTVGETTETFELVSPNNEGCSRFSDNTKTQIRVHTLLVGSEES